MKLLNLNVIIIAIMLSACSTVNRGASDHFRIDTVPQGATVTTSVIDMSKKKRRKNQYGRYQDKNVVTAYHGCAPTPCAIKLPRRSEFVVSIEHPAYETTELFIRSSSLKGGTTTSIVRTDPLVGLHKTMVQAKSFSDTICAKRKKDRIAGEPSCKETRATYQEEKAAYQTLKRQQLDDFKAALKMAKAKEKTTVTP